MVNILFDEFDLLLYVSFMLLCLRGMSYKFILKPSTLHVYKDIVENTYTRKQMKINVLCQKKGCLSRFSYYTYGYLCSLAYYHYYDNGDDSLVYIPI